MTLNNEMQYNYAVSLGGSNVPLIETMHEGCAPNQYLREIARNALDALARVKKSNSKKGDKIIKRVEVHPILCNGVEKMCIADTGPSMVRAEIEDFMGGLGHGYGEKNKRGNFGIGAKIATLPISDLLYVCFPENEPPHATIFRKTTINGFPNYAGCPLGWDEYCESIDTPKSPILDGTTSGTMVILLGKDPSQNTMESALQEVPVDARIVQKREGKVIKHRQGLHWATYYFNDRFYKLPKDVEFHVDRGREYKAGKARAAVNGQCLLMNGSRAGSYMRKKGVVRLSKGRIEWGILSEESARPSSHGCSIDLLGNICTIHDNEVYSLRDRTRGLDKASPKYGITLGMRYVVLHYFPDNVTASVTRSGLERDGVPIDIDEMADEFDMNMPNALRTFLIEERKKREKGKATKREDRLTERVIRQIDNWFNGMFKYIANPIVNGMEVIRKHKLPVHKGTQKTETESTGVILGPRSESSKPITGDAAGTRSGDRQLARRGYKPPEFSFIEVPEEEGDHFAEYSHTDNTFNINVAHPSWKRLAEHLRDAYQRASFTEIENEMQHTLEVRFTEHYVFALGDAESTDVRERFKQVANRLNRETLHNIFTLSLMSYEEEISRKLGLVLKRKPKNIADAMEEGMEEVA